MRCTRYIKKLKWEALALQDEDIVCLTRDSIGNMGDLDTDMGMESEEILSGTCKWTEKMYDMAYDPYDDDKNEVLQYVKNNGKNQIVYIEYNYKQLGLTEEWARNLYDKIDNPITFKREILLQRLHGSSESPFDRDDLEYVIGSMQNPVDELFLLDHFRFDIYEPLEKHLPYVVGVDCSTGTNGDSNAITIIHPYTVRPVAEFACPYIGESMFENLLVQLIRQVIPKAILCIERNSIGDGIVDHLLLSPIRANLYYDKNRDIVEQSISSNVSTESLLKKKAEAKKYTGVYTEGKSREYMIGILMDRMTNNKEDFVTKNIITDITRLIRFKTGKIAAAPGFHDDSIMSYLIGMYVYMHGNNLPLFGLVKGQQYAKEKNDGLDRVEDVLSSNVVPEEDKDVIRKQVIMQQSNNFEEMLRQSMAQAQRESLKLHDKKLADNKVIEATPSVIVEDMQDNYDLSIFDELNNAPPVYGSQLNPYGPYGQPSPSGFGAGMQDPYVLGGYGPLTGKRPF